MPQAPLKKLTRRPPIRQVRSWFPWRNLAIYENPSVSGEQLGVRAGILEGAEVCSTHKASLGLRRD